MYIAWYIRELMGGLVFTHESERSGEREGEREM
jgi:hypothetical protein